VSLLADALDFLGRSLLEVRRWRREHPHLAAAEFRARAVAAEEVAARWRAKGRDGLARIAERRATRNVRRAMRWERRAEARRRG